VTSPPLGWVFDPTFLPPRIKGSSVVLRGFEARDAEVFVEAGTDPVTSSMFPDTAPVDCDMEQALRIAEVVSRRVANFGMAFAVSDATTDRAIGYIVLGLYDLPKGRISLGVWTSPLRRGNGHMTDALRAIIAWAPALDGVRRLDAVIATWNVASQRAFEKAGFHREAMLRRYELCQGIPQDVYIYTHLVDR